MSIASGGFTAFLQSYVAALCIVSKHAGFPYEESSTALRSVFFRKFAYAVRLIQGRKTVNLPKR